MAPLPPISGLCETQGNRMIILLNLPSFVCNSKRVARPVSTIIQVRKALTVKEAFPSQIAFRNNRTLNLREVLPLPPNTVLTHALGVLARYRQLWPANKGAHEAFGMSFAFSSA